MNRIPTILSLTILSLGASPSFAALSPARARAIVQDRFTHARDLEWVKATHVLKRTPRSTWVAFVTDGEELRVAKLDNRRGAVRSVTPNLAKAVIRKATGAELARRDPAAAWGHLNQLEESSFTPSGRVRVTVYSRQPRSLGASWRARYSVGFLSTGRVGTAEHERLEHVYEYRY